MWSYRDAQQQEHTRIEYSEIRRLINEGAITPDSLVKNQHIGEWVKAGETSFFIGQEGHDSEVTEPQDSNPPEPTAPLPLRSKSKYIWHSPFIALAVLSLVTLCYPSYKYLTEQSEKAKHQQSVDQHFDLVYQKENKEARLLELEKECDDITKAIKDQGYKVDWTLPIYEPLVGEERELRQSLQDHYTSLPETPSAHPFVLASERIMQKHLELGKLLTLVLLAPLLCAFFHYYKGSQIKTQKTILRVALALLHALPVINFLLYTHYSAKWNLESVQRKNALIVSLPLALAAIVCSGLAVYHYSNNPHYTLYSLCFIIFLWSIIHYRFVQMVNYYHRYEQLRS